MTERSDCKYCKLMGELDTAASMRDRAVGAEAEAWDTQVEAIMAELEAMEVCDHWPVVDSQGEPAYNP